MSATATEMVVLDAQLSDPIHVGRHRMTTVRPDVVRLVEQLHAAYATELAGYRALHQAAWSRRGWALTAGVLGGLLAWWFWSDHPEQMVAALVGGVLTAWLAHASIGSGAISVPPAYKCMGGCGKTLTEQGYCRRCSSGGGGRRGSEASDV